MPEPEEQYQVAQPEVPQISDRLLEIGRQTNNRLQQERKQELVQQFVEEDTKRVGEEIKRIADEEQDAQHPLRQIAEDPVSIWTLPRAMGWTLSWLFTPLNIAKERMAAVLQGAPLPSEKENLKWMQQHYPEQMTTEQLIRLNTPSAPEEFFNPFSWGEREINVLKGKRYAATWCELLHDAGYSPYFAGIVGAVGEVTEAYAYNPAFVSRLTKSGQLASQLTEEGKVISRTEQLARLDELRKLAGNIPKIEQFAKEAKVAGDKLGMAAAVRDLQVAKKAGQKIALVEKLYKQRAAFESGKVLEPLGETLYERGIRGQVAPLALDLAGVQIELKSPAFYKGLNWLYGKMGLVPEKVTGIRAGIKEVVTGFERTTFDKQFDKYFTDYVNNGNYMMGEMTDDIKQIAKLRNQVAKQIYQDALKAGQKITKGEAAQSAEDLIINLGEIKVTKEIAETGKRLSILDDFRRKLSPQAVQRSEQAAELLKGIGKKALAFQQNVGLDISPIGGDLDYITHAITPEAYKIYNKTGGLSNRAQKGYNAWHSSMLQREVSAEMMITEFNKKVFEGNFPGLEAWKGVKFFDTDPVVIAHITAQRAANAASKYAFIDNIVQPETIRTYNRSTRKWESTPGKGYARTVVDLGNKKVLRELQIANPDYAFYIRDSRRFRTFPVDKLPEGIVNEIKTVGLAEVTEEMLSEVRGLTTRGIKAYLLPKYVAAEVGKTVSRSSKLPQFYQLARYYDNAMDWMRAQALVSTGFHFRNVIGGNIPNYLIEGGNPKHWVTAAKLQTNNSVTIISPTGRIYQIEEILDLLDKHGVRGTGWAASEAVPQRIKDIYRNSANPLQRNFIVFTANRKLGRVLEDNARIALFVDGLEKGLEPARAAIRVDKTLFTYDPRKLPESYKWLRRVAYFPRWKLANMQFQLQKLFENPRAFRVYENISQGIGKLSEPISDIDKVPDWVLEAGGIKLEYDENGKRKYFIPGGFFSPSELKTLEHPLDELFSQLAPFPKTIVEQAIGKGGYNFFFKGEIEKYTGEKGTYLGIPMQKRLIHLLRNIRTLNDLDRYIFKEDETGTIAKNLRQWLGLSVVHISEQKTKKWKQYQENLEKGARKKAKKKARQETLAGEE